MSPKSHKLEWLLLMATGLALIVTAAVYIQFRVSVGRTYAVPVVELDVPAGPAAIAEGERLARVRGCFWCHGDAMQGGQYFANATRGVIAIAPNLTLRVKQYTPGEFARAVRHGIKQDGTSLQPAMPSFAFYNMNDADMGAIIAYIKSLPEQPGDYGRFELLPVGWYRWAAGQLPPVVADLIDHDAPRPDAAVNGDAISRGRYLAESVCTECHGNNGRLRVPGSPDLQIAAAYPYEDFVRLMRTGVPLTERKIDYHMVDAAKYRYTELTDAEVDALYAYFRSMLSPSARADTP